MHATNVMASYNHTEHNCGLYTEKMPMFDWTKTTLQAIKMVPFCFWLQLWRFWSDFYALCTNGNSNQYV